MIGSSKGTVPPRGQTPPPWKLIRCSSCPTNQRISTTGRVQIKCSNILVLPRLGQLPSSLYHIGLQITNTYTYPVKHHRLLYWENEVLWNLAQSREFSWAHSEILLITTNQLNYIRDKSDRPFMLPFWLWSLHLSRSLGIVGGQTKWEGIFITYVP